MLYFTGFFTFFLSRKESHWWPPLSLCHDLNKSSLLGHPLTQILNHKTGSRLPLRPMDPCLCIHCHPPFQLSLNFSYTNHSHLIRALGINLVILARSSNHSHNIFSFHIFSYFLMHAYSHIYYAMPIKSFYLHAM